MWEFVNARLCVEQSGCGERRKKGGGEVYGGGNREGISGRKRARR